jgi:hypothetical protein
MSRKPEASDNTGKQLAPALMHDRQCSGRELPVGLEERIKERARRLGFALVGIAAAVPPESLPHLQSWLAQGLAGSMEYMHRQAEARSHPRYVFQRSAASSWLG